MSIRDAKLGQAARSVTWRRWEKAPPSNFRTVGALCDALVGKAWQSDALRRRAVRGFALRRSAQTCEAARREALLRLARPCWEVVPPPLFRDDEGSMICKVWRCAARRHDERQCPASRGVALLRVVAFCRGAPPSLSRWRGSVIRSAALRIVRRGVVLFCDAWLRGALFSSAPRKFYSAADR